MNINFPFDDVNFSLSTNDFPNKNLLLIEDGIFIGQDEIQFSMEDIGSFKVSKGTHIEFYPYNQSIDPALMELYINGPVLGAILHQRKILPIHASSVSFNDRGLLFCGDSGAGKSTMAFIFSQIGASVLTDDISPILVEKGDVFVSGYATKLKLWEDTFQKLKIPKTSKQKIWVEDEREKFYHPLENNNTKQKIHHLFFLKIGTKLNFKKLKGLEKFKKLHYHIFRNEFTALMPETQKSYIQQMKEICAQCEMIEISRPKEIHPIELKDFLLSLINV